MGRVLNIIKNSLFFHKSLVYKPFDILIDIQSDIEGDEQEWEVFIPDGGILFVSELGVFTNEGDHTQRASFKVLEN